MNFPAKLRRAGRSASATGGGARSRPRLHGPEPVRLPGGSGGRGDAARAESESLSAAAAAGARRHRDRARHGEYDFVSRFFAPGSGIDEDPVTGSAHSALAPFWSKRLGKTEMIGFQASARGGVVKVRMEGDRVYMSGQAVTVLRGDLLF